VTIPHRYIFVWTGREFPLFARIAVESVALHDPDAEIQLHVFGDEENLPIHAPHFRALLTLPSVTVHRVDLATTFEGLDAPVEQFASLFRAIPPTAYSAQSNLIRYGLLHRFGGIYVDFDVVLLHSLRDLLHLDAFIGEEAVWVVNRHRVAGERELWMIKPTLVYVAAWLLRRGEAALGGRGQLDVIARPLDAIWSTPNLNNAVIGSPAGGAYLRRVLDAALHADPTIRFNLGPTLVSRVHQADPSDVIVLPPEYFFVEPPSYSFRFFESRPYALPSQTRLLHYVSSNHGALLRGLSEDVILARRDRALFYKHAAEVIEGRA